MGGPPLVGQVRGLNALKSYFLGGGQRINAQASQMWSASRSTNQTVDLKMWRQEVVLEGRAGR